MHSKVIIASLVCMLAASFNCNKGLTHFVTKNNGVIAKEIVSRAPNDYQGDIWLSTNDGNAGDSFRVSLSFEKEWPGCEILSKSSGLTANCSFYGTYAEVNITTATSSGNKNVKIGYRLDSQQIVLATIYIYSDGVHYCASPCSPNEAKSMFFKYHVATSEECGNISYRDYFNFKYDSYNPYETAKYETEKHYTDYVYGSTSDVMVDVVTSPHNTSSSSDTRLVMHTMWVDSMGVCYPLSGIKVDFLQQNYNLLGQGDLHFTDSEGQFTVVLSQNETYGMLLNDIKCRTSAVCKATSVEDIFYQNYPVCYSSSSFAPLSNYSQVDYFIYIKSGKSDRAFAYEITQAQTVPYDYVSKYVDSLDTIITRFPADHTDYVRYRERLHMIDIQREDAHCWDVLNHEYGHYICDTLGLCNMNDYRTPHGIHEDLGEYGLDLAYSEGLATYLGLAAQLDTNNRFNIAEFGDEIYQDSHRDVYVNYNQYAPGKPEHGHFYGERVESSVTSVLIKLLDDNKRANDYVSLGHVKMWNLIRFGSADYNPFCSIVDLLNKAIELYSNKSFIDTIRGCEFIAKRIFTYSEKADWTIMLYICGSNLESGDKNEDGTWKNPVPSGLASSDIEEILSVKEKPKNVNILIQTGGSERWKNSQIDANSLCRFTVESQNNNNYLQLRKTLQKNNMGKQTTLESFLSWGFENYPAKKTGVILWNHGGGLGGVCFDNYGHPDYSDALTDDEVANALDSAMYENRVDKLEFIGYDACLMQIQDVAEFNSNYAKYMVGSETGVSGYGWAYDKWLGDVYTKQSTINILKKIADTYVSSDGGNSACSVLDLSRMSNYKTKFESVAAALGTLSIEPTALAVASAYSFGYNGKNNGTVDGLGFLIALLNNNELMNTNGLRSKVDSAITAYNQVVKYNNAGNKTNGKINGLAIHFAGAKKYARVTLSIMYGAMPNLPSIIVNALLNAALSQYDEPYYPPAFTHFTMWRSISF